MIVYPTGEGVLFKMQGQTEHITHIKKGKGASKAHKEICAMHGVNAVTERPCQYWKFFKNYY